MDDTRKKRYKYNLSHLSHIAGQIGRIQTVCAIPIEAGASLELDINAFARIAPNRKEIVSDTQFDIIAFSMPVRGILGQPFVDWLNSGLDTSGPLPVTNVPVAAAYRTADYLGLPIIKGTTVDRLLLETYNRVFYNFFAIPGHPYNADNIVTNTVFDWFPTTEAGAQNCRAYGRLAARLPHILNGAASVNVGLAGWEAQGLEPADSNVSVTGGVFTLQNLSAIMGRYKAETASAWFNHWYQDIMKDVFGGHASEDADPRNIKPQMLGRHTQMLSGTDVAGMDDATIGTFQGKQADRVSFHMPRKFFGEHSIVIVLALARFPLVHYDEIHPFFQTTVPKTYDYWAGNPDRTGALAPVGFSVNEWLLQDQPLIPINPPDIQMPYGQQYRYHPNRVHNNFRKIPGYPFSNWTMDSLTTAYYHSDNEYYRSFVTPQIGQWQMQSQVIASKMSRIPTVESSIFAGAN